MGVKFDIVVAGCIAWNGVGVEVTSSPLYFARLIIYGKVSTSFYVF
jgi:hypothetical protein